MTNTTLAERLKVAMRAAGYTQSKLAEAVGVSQGAIQKISSGQAKSTTKIMELAKALSVRPEWLATGDGAMINDSIPEEKKWSALSVWDSGTPLDDDEVEVPFLKDIEFACGDGRIMEEDYNGFKLRFSKSTLRRVGARSDGSGILCFPAAGTSMEPIIPDGTTVAVNTDDKRIVDGKMYAISQGGWKRIKVLHRTAPDKVAIKSYNSAEFPDEEASIKDVEIIGRVFWTSTIW